MSLGGMIYGNNAASLMVGLDDLKDLFQSYDSVLFLCFSVLESIATIKSYLGISA